MQAVILGIIVTAWAALHSWLASTSMKVFVSRRAGVAGSRVYRLAYNIASFVSLIPIGWWMQTLPDHLLYEAEAPLSVFMIGAQGLVAGLSVVTLLQTGAMQFAGISQVLGSAESDRLSTTGFYRIVRHPLYLFGLLFLWAAPRMTLNQLAVTVVFSAYLFIGALLEERRLVREFGEAYLAYRNRTPMVIPRLWPRRGA